jgi:hypothetical protein
MLAAYLGERVRLSASAESSAESARLLDLCRLHHAVQWLAWSDQWTPPADQSRDWLSEALRLAERVNPSQAPNAARYPAPEPSSVPSKRLIVNADDLGFSEGVNCGII